MPHITARIDKELMNLKEVLEQESVTAAMLRTAIEGAYLRMLVVSTVFKKRFPKDFEQWEAED